MIDSADKKDLYGQFRFIVQEKALMASLDNQTVQTVSQAKAFQTYARNSSYVIPGIYELEVEDTNWVLTSSFIIFTMQTGFGIVTFIETY